MPIMKQNPLRFLPLIIILFSVVGVLSWYTKSQKLKLEIKPETINPSQLDSENLVLSPTPSSFFFSDEPASVPSTSEDSTPETVNEKGGMTVFNESVTTTTTTRICTPVYGMADTCTEHIVVDTGAESAVAYSLSAFSYLAGLVAFVKSKKT